MPFRETFWKPTGPAPPRSTAVAHVTWLTAPDIGAVRTINASVRDPWPSARLALMLVDPLVNTMVAKRGCVVVGFKSYHIHPLGIELLHFAVAPAHRSVGIGSQMFGLLRSKLRAHGRPRLTTAISELDEETWGWFVRRGMRGIGVDRDGIGPGTDAYRFEMLDGGPAGIGAVNCPSGTNDVP